jgi:cobalt/nickel transport system ATP-binding protein
VVTATHDLSIVDAIADRVFVFNEQHRLVAEGTPSAVLANEALLIECNLIHEHRHVHADGPGVHSHPHQHGAPHVHPH